MLITSFNNLAKPTEKTSLPGYTPEPGVDIEIISRPISFQTVSNIPRRVDKVSPLLCMNLRWL